MGNGNKRLVRIEGDSLAQLQKERMELISNHLEQMGHITTIINQQVDIALTAELKLSGVPVAEVDQEELIERCEQFGKRAGFARLKRYNEGVKEICELLNVRDLPDFVVWSALKAGGVQLPVTEVEELPESSKLITEH